MVNRSCSASATPPMDTRRDSTSAAVAVCDAPAEVERAAGRGGAQHSTARSTAAHVGGATRLAEALRSRALQQRVGEPRRWTRGVLQAAVGSVAADGQQLVHAEKCA